MAYHGRSVFFYSFMIVLLLYDETIVYILLNKVQIPQKKQGCWQRAYFMLSLLTFFKKMRKSP